MGDSFTAVSLFCLSRCIRHRHKQAQAEVGAVTQGQRARDRFGEGKPERCSWVTAAQPLTVESLALEFEWAQTA